MSIISLKESSLQENDKSCLVNPALFTKVEEIRKCIHQEGYCVVSNVIDKQNVFEMKDFWISFLKKKNVTRRYVRGELFLGEDNFLAYSKTKSDCLFRNFDFYWNKPTNENTSAICLELHRFRNFLMHKDENDGLQINRENFGIYASTSLYVSGEGHLEKHNDGHSVIQFMLPLSFKGTDFYKGGLFVINKKGKKIMVDDFCEEGSLIFFHPLCTHGVEKIEGGGFGRLSVFAIPIHFKKDASLGVFQRSAKVLFKEWKDKILLTS